MLLQNQTENFQNNNKKIRYTCAWLDLSYEMQMSLVFHIHHGKQQTSPLPYRAINHPRVYSGSFLVCCPSFVSPESNIFLRLYVV